MEMLKFIIDKIKVNLNNDISNSNIFCGEKTDVFFEILNKNVISEINEAIIYGKESYSDLYERLLRIYTIPEIEFEIIRTKPHKVHAHYPNGENELYSEMEINFTFNFFLTLLDFTPSQVFRANQKLIFYRNINDKILTYEIKISENLINEPDNLNEPIVFIKENIQNLNSDIAYWNKKFKELIDTKLSNYNKGQEKINKLYQDLHVKTNADRFITPQPIKRKITPQPYTKNKIAVISPEIYKDIITTLKNVGRSIEGKRRIYLEAYEKKTSLYKTEAEDYFRDIFQLFLETRYESVSATGETFNKEGKADITLKNTVDNSNIFIAECKIWYNVNQSCNKAIEQLLGYITIRETKTALLIFVKDNDITNKIAEFKDCIQKSKYFKKHIEDEDNYSFKYLLNYKDEYNIEIILTVLFFHFPQNKIEQIE